MFQMLFTFVGHFVRYFLFFGLLAVGGIALLLSLSAVLTRL